MNKAEITAGRWYALVLDGYRFLFFVSNIHSVGDYTGYGGSLLALDRRRPWICSDPSKIAPLNDEDRAQLAAVGETIP